MTASRDPGPSAETRPLQWIVRLCIAVALATAISFCVRTERPEGSFRDDLGRVVRVPRRITRVVTLAPNLTEIVAAIGAEKLLVGTDDFSNYPPSVKALPKLGGMTPSVEAIARLKPDMVFAPTSGSTPSVAAPLAALGIPLIAVRTDRLADVTRAMTQIGTLLEADGEGGASAVRRGIETARKTRPQQPRVLALVWANPLYVAGRDTFMDDLIQVAGARNAVPPEVKGWPQYSMEAVLKDPPDLIVFAEGAVSRPQIMKVFEDDERWQAVKAVRAGHIYGVDEDLFTRPGPRVGIAAKELAGVLDRWESR